MAVGAGSRGRRRGWPGNAPIATLMDRAATPVSTRDPMIDTFPCPQCGILLRRSPALEPGVLVKCPKCTHQFRVPDLENSGLPTLELIDPPEEPKRREAPPARDENPFAFEDPAGVPPAFARGNASLDFDDDAPQRRPEINLDKYAPDRPRRERPVEDGPPPRRRERDLDEDDDGPRRRADLDFEEDEDRPRRGRLDTLPTDHTVDIGSSYRLAWSCTGEFIGPAIGFIFVAILILIPVLILAMIPLLGFFIYLIVVLSLLRGPQFVALRVVRGKDWSFNDFFGGFHYIGQLIGLAFFQGILSFVSYIPTVIMLIITEVMFSNRRTTPNGEIIEGAGMMATGVLGLVIFVYLEARLFTFAFQLVVHKKLGVIEAMRGCWRLSEGHTLSFIGVNLLSVLTAVSGAVLVCFGMLFTAPFSCLFVAAVYARMMGIPTADEDSRPTRLSRRAELDEDDRPRTRRTSPSPRDDY